MVQNNRKLQNIILIISALLFFIGGLPSLSFAKDTDIYQINTKQNCMILLDNSGSMRLPVYEKNIDYAKMYEYLITLSYIDDPYAGKNIANNLYERNKIYIIKPILGQISLKLLKMDNKTLSILSDPSYYNIVWDMASIVETHVSIDFNGNLTNNSSGKQRITIDKNGYVLLDGEQLALDRSIKLKDMVSLNSGTQIDKGFGHLITSSGFYFSGYKNVKLGNLEIAVETYSYQRPPTPLPTNGASDIYFFVTGNWLNQQAVYNLRYNKNCNNGYWLYPWNNEIFPQSLSEINYEVRYPTTPNSGNYSNDLKESKTIQTITHPGAKFIQLHFSKFDVEGDSNTYSTNNDYVAIYDTSNNLINKYDNDNSPIGWTSMMNGDTFKIALKTNSSNVKSGFIIDKIRVNYGHDIYKIQSRLDIAKNALLYILDKFQGKMNWGFAVYHSNGARRILNDLNPNIAEDEDRNIIINLVKDIYPNGMTPIGGALQDVFVEAYYNNNSGLKDLHCHKSYVISLTDGYPCSDRFWNKIPGIDFSNKNMNDGDGWEFDGEKNYYDDVGHWMFTHSWKDKTEVTDPANSYDNIITHHISLSMENPFLKDAAEESGGLYLEAYNKTGLVNAFHAMTLNMTKEVSFTSSVVSVDFTNKIQHGDDLYLGLFLPQRSQSWIGNLKKFKLGDGSVDRPNIWMIYDKNDNEAINDSGIFLDNTSAFWSNNNGVNNSGNANVKKDGAGEVLKEWVDDTFISKAYWERPIYTYDSANKPNMKKVNKDNITKEELGVSDDLTRDKVINFLYGYTYDAGAKTNAITGVRDWVLGGIVHSSPVVIDYYNPDDISKLEKRYIVVGANDGMLHFFDDTTGKEIFAFVPQDLLPKLKLLPNQPFVDMVDGDITLYRSDKQPKYLIFGERKGGGKYWCLDISDTDPLKWSVKWVFSNDEIAQSWSKPMISTIPVSIDTKTGKRTFKDILIFTGGYDPEEDNYPEPFNDVNNNGSPFTADGKIDENEWKSSNDDQDINDNDLYDYYNLEQNEYGRGIYAIDIEDGSNIIFSATYGDKPDESTNIQTLDSMKFCFPASPSVVNGTYAYVYKENGKIIKGRKSNVLKAIYAIDIYSNLYRVDYSFEVNDDTDNDNSTFGPFLLNNNKWKVTKIFSGNPGSLSSSGSFGAGEKTEPKENGRKTFYSPVVSWGGACNYLDSGNYRFTDTTFSDQNKITSLYFGTGDREHSTYTMIKNRFYAVYDDSSVKAVDTANNKTVIVSNVPYNEDNLLNLTCNDLDTGSSLSENEKNVLKENLRDDPIYADSTKKLALEEDTNENDTKGWYIIFDKQGSDSDMCDKGMDTENHKGEKMLSKANLYDGILYFTTFQPDFSDTCNPKNNGFTYALNYCDGTAGYNLNTSNDSSNNSTDDYTYDVSDRSKKIINILGIPSGFTIVTRKGQTGAMAMIGEKIIGTQKDTDGNNVFVIKSPGMGLELYYWRESNSQK